MQIADPKTPVRIVHCDDSEPVRALVAGVLRDQPGLDIVAQAASHADLVTQTAWLQPDLVILDLDAGRDEHVVGELRALTDAQILVLSGSSDPAHDPLVAQADGFVSKAAGMPAIMRAILAAAAPRR